MCVRAQRLLYELNRKYLLKDQIMDDFKIISLIIVCDPGIFAEEMLQQPPSRQFKEECET